MLDILFFYVGIGVACIPFVCFAFYTTAETNEREERLVFWLAMLTIGVATVFLWPAITYLIVNHFVLERRWRRKDPKQYYQIEIEESWKKVTSLSKKLDETLNYFLDSDEFNGEAEKRIRDLFAEIEQEYDRWLSSRKILSSFRDSLTDDEKVVRDLAYLEEGRGWPRLRVAVRVDYDPLTKERKISHSTVRSLFPQEPEEEPSHPIKYNEIFVSFMEQKALAEGENRQWSVTASGRFRAAIKKLRGLEKEKVEAAVTDIMLSPTSAHGNTKTPLSNNLRDFWRYRLGDWRIIYAVDSRAKTVTMLDYSHRSKTYH